MGATEGDSLEQVLVVIDYIFDAAVHFKDLLVMATALVSCAGLNHIRHFFEDFVDLSGKLGLHFFPVFFNKLYVKSLLVIVPFSIFQFLLGGLIVMLGGEERLIRVKFLCDGAIII